MIQINTHTDIPRSARDCFAYLSDFSTCEQWDPAVYRARKLTPGKPRIGTEFRVIVSLLGRRKTLRYRITELMADERITLRGRGAGIATTETITFDGDDGQCRVAYRGEFSLRGPTARAGRLAHPFIHRMISQAIKGLKAALTVDDKPRRQGWLSYAADRSVLVGEALFTDRGYFAMSNRSHAEFMSDRVVAVTGATGGIGQAIASEYARLGARVVLIGRDSQRLADAAQRVRDVAGSDPTAVETIEADLLNIGQVQRAGQQLLARHPRLDVLINNAGAMFHDYATSADGIERTVAVNLVAPFVLTETVMPGLLAAGGRVVNMASGGMYAARLNIDALSGPAEAHGGLSAYARAKRALVALNFHWSRRYGDAGIIFNAMHPGWVATPGVAKALPRFNALLRPVLRDARMGADTAVWLGASAAARHANGQFFLDRTPRPTAVIPGTRFKPSEAQSLYGWLRQTSGIDVHGLR
ncbi:MAG: SDR family NAD(P)-dependent oxidoreductase [Salinisphaera sp.]|jgi:dehydrogenase/reductase SDR family protein 12|nr:SDR family NAD(P)-dependent oxidoreductase [Salinisphaera sp.]